MTIPVSVDNKIGQVTTERYDQLVTQARELIHAISKAQFAIGDLILEIEPMRPAFNIESAIQEDAGVEAALHRFAADIGINVHTLKSHRWVSSRWPVEHRQVDVTHTVHKILASLPDQARRWELIKTPPLDERTGQYRWTPDAAKRVVGFQVDHPFTVKEKVEAVHELAVDEQVAARVVTDLLHRPDVAFKAMADDTAKQMVNRAQVDHAFQAMERNIEPVAPILREVARPLQFVDLIAACALFASSIERAMPQLHGHRFTEQEQEAVRDRLRQVRAAADWVEHAIETGDTTLEESLAALLRNPGPDPA